VPLTPTFHKDRSTSLCLGDGSQNLKFDLLLSFLGWKKTTVFLPLTHAQTTSLSTRFTVVACPKFGFKPSTLISTDKVISPTKCNHRGRVSKDADRGLPEIPLFNHLKYETMDHSWDVPNAQFVDLKPISNPTTVKEAITITAIDGQPHSFRGYLHRDWCTLNALYVAPAYSMTWLIAPWGFTGRPYRDAFPSDSSRIFPTPISQALAARCASPPSPIPCPSPIWRINIPRQRPEDRTEAIGGANRAADQGSRWEAGDADNGDSHTGKPRDGEWTHGEITI